MDLGKIGKQIEELVGSGSVRRNEPMWRHTSYRVGGPADILVSPDSLEGLIKLISFLKSENVPHIVIGRGTNLVVKDGGIRGVVVKTCEGIGGITVNGNGIEAESGALLSDIARLAWQNSLAGFEFASGIPGTLGGAVVMNAGAYGREMKDVVVETECIDAEGNFLTLRGEEHEFDNRGSVMQKKGYIVLKSRILLEPGDKDGIYALIRDLDARRREKQPLDEPSAGSVFKRPKGNYASKLIEECGLKGMACGGAQVSEKHCGFIVNKGNAKAADILELIEKIRLIVEKERGIILQPEVRIIGEDL